MTTFVNEVEVYEQYEEWALIRDRDNAVLDCIDEFDARDMAAMSIGLGEPVTLVRRTIYVMPFEQVPV